MIRLPVPAAGVTAAERFALDILIDLSRLVPAPPAFEATRLELSDDNHGPRALRTWAAVGWGMEALDGAVRVPRAVLRAVIDVAGAAVEQHATARDRYSRVPSSENPLVREGVGGGEGRGSSANPSSSAPDSPSRTRRAGPQGAARFER